METKTKIDGVERIWMICSHLGLYHLFALFGFVLQISDSTIFINTRILDYICNPSKIIIKYLLKSSWHLI